MPPVCHDFLFKKAAKVRRLVKESELVSLGNRWKVTTNPKERKICRWGGPRESPPQILCRTYRDRLPSLLKISPTPPLSLFFGHRVNVGPQAPVARACASFGRKDGLSGKIHAASSWCKHNNSKNSGRTFRPTRLHERTGNKLRRGARW
jgi:hypothetical protein